MKPQTFIFIGRSGSGKGTQADLLTEFLKKQDSSRAVFRLESGKIFREFIQKDSYTSKISNEIYQAGGLQPEFLSVWIWAEGFIKSMNPNDHMIVDGAPRKVAEGAIFDSAISFYKRDNPHVIFMNVSRKWAEQRLAERHRLDDTPRDIKKRMDWYETDVAPTVEYFRNNERYHFHEIHAEASVEEVHKQIVEGILHGNN